MPYDNSAHRYPNRNLNRNRNRNTRVPIAVPICACQLTERAPAHAIDSHALDALSGCHSVSPTFCFVEQIDCGWRDTIRATPSESPAVWGQRGLHSPAAVRLLRSLTTPLRGIGGSAVALINSASVIVVTVRSVSTGPERATPNRGGQAARADGGTRTHGTRLGPRFVLSWRGRHLILVGDVAGCLGAATPRRHHSLSAERRRVTDPPIRRLLRAAAYVGYVGWGRRVGDVMGVAHQP